MGDQFDVVCEEDLESGVSNDAVVVMEDDDVVVVNE